MRHRLQAYAPANGLPHDELPAWIETILYRFLGGSRYAQYPWSRLTFDSAGNIYGTSGPRGHPAGAGTVYKLARSNGGWSETVIHTFSGPDGYGPHSEVIFDTAGNLYGTTYQGGSDNFGVVYELSPTQSGWVETVIYNAVGHRPAPAVHRCRRDIWFAQHLVRGLC